MSHTPGHSDNLYNPDAGAAVAGQQQGPEEIANQIWMGAQPTGAENVNVAHRYQRQGRRGAFGHSFPGGTPTRGMRTKTMAELISELRSMDKERLVALQVKLAEAGFFGDAQPILGVVTSETVQAFKGLMAEALGRPDKTYTEVLSEIADSRMDSLFTGEDGVLGTKSGSGDTEVMLSDATEIRNSAQEYAQQELGMLLTDDQLNVLVGATHAREKQNAIRNYAAAGGGATVAGVSETELSQFMRALGGTESGGDYGAENGRTAAYGKYQILPSNWPSWSRRAGLPPGAPPTPANQELVAKTVIAGYYKQFGNWRDVAIAWYAGPGRVNKLRNQDMQVQGGKEPSVHEYAQTVVSRMKKGVAEEGTTEGGLMFLENNSIDLKEEVRNLDPSRAKAKDFADTMGEFFSLLGGSE